MKSSQTRSIRFTVISLTDTLLQCYFASQLLSTTLTQLHNYFVSQTTCLGVTSPHIYFAALMFPMTSTDAEMDAIQIQVNTTTTEHYYCLAFTRLHTHIQFVIIQSTHCWPTMEGSTHAYPYSRRISISMRGTRTADFQFKTVPLKLIQQQFVIAT